jgi:hypothetical protein
MNMYSSLIESAVLSCFAVLDRAVNMLVFFGNLSAPWNSRNQALAAEYITMNKNTDEEKMFRRLLMMLNGHFSVATAVNSFGYTNISYVSRRT